MNRRTQPQWTVSGIVEAPVDQVWTALLKGDFVLSPEIRARIAHASRTESAPLRVSLPSAASNTLNVEIDPPRHTFAIAGQWWYRGVYTVNPHPQGSCLSYNIYNIAPGVSWWLAQAVQGPQTARGMDQQFRQLLDALGKQLGCKAYLAA
jgi:hypothetical protein